MYWTITFLNSGDAKPYHLGRPTGSALQRNDDLRQQFKAEISVFNPNQLVFLDETGIVRIKERSIPLS